MHRHPSPKHPHRNPRSASELLIAGLCSLDDRIEKHRFAADLHFDDSFALYANGKQLTVLDREAMLAKMRTGEGPTALEVTATTYLQGDKPNRKFVRFKDSKLAAIAKSFKGQPFLRDHNSYEVEARGGTILDSELIDGPKGTKGFAMTLKLVKPWAIEGALDGTIDRFSIGWSRTDAVLCSLHNTPAFQKCNCYPGDDTGKGDGSRVEFVFTGAEGTEVSAVNVPAVVGTGVTTISQLAALDRDTLAGILGDGTDRVPQPKDNSKMIDPKILAALGLSATATLEDVLTKLAANADALTIASGAKQTLEAELKAFRAEEATRLAATKKTTIDAAITTLIGAGKIKPGSPMELALRRTGERDLDVLSAQMKDLLETGAQVTPVGATILAGGTDPVPANGGAGVPLDGKQFLAANPETAKWLKLAGVTVEQFEKHGSHARETIAAQHARG